MNLSADVKAAAATSGVAMVDRAAIFAELSRRNAVRREANLPLLDMHAEFVHAVEVAAWREASVNHADDMACIEQDVLIEMRARRGVGFPQSIGGHWIVGFEVTKRVLALLAADGIHPPTPRHTVGYGADRLERGEKT